MFLVDPNADTEAEYSRSDQNILELVISGPNDGKATPKQEPFVAMLNRIR